ncbi:MAG: DNA-invertase hin [Alphaproteobacteria bacterium MarineAlpha9_Bin2]|nr:MAG: DNA-invertase hin [Alphaproteobacteria bacterium MarineAlpha9_Bin2]
MTKKVVIYARTSLGLDKQNCDRQVAELKEIVKNNNWELVDTYVDEGYSRTTSSRPQLDRMMKDAFVRKFEMVITLELSRLGTSLKHMIDIVEKFKERKIQLFIVNQQIDTSTVSGYMFFSIMTSIANYERELISERVKSGLENARRKGIRLGRKTNLTPEIEGKIIELKKQGVGYNTLAKRVSVSVRTIRSVLRKVA